MPHPHHLACRAKYSIAQISATPSITDNQPDKHEMNKADRDLKDFVFSAAARKHPLWRMDEVKGEAIPLDGAPDEDDLVEWFEKTCPDEVELAIRGATRRPN
jgi:hypothetical protein